jgi:phytoene dehydrogenase-like protein
VKRLFQGLRQPPDARYDVVVIGSGIGGLITANLLAASGASVLLVEQHYMVGGYCSTFRRAGYTFDAATHFYPLLGNPATLSGRLLGELDVTTQWIKMDPVDVFHLPDGTRIEVPADFDRYLALLKREFPHQASELDTYFALAQEANLAGILYYFRGRSTPRVEKLLPLTVSEVLARHFSDPRLRLVLTGDCPHWGSPPGRTSFVFDAMLRMSFFLGNYYPVGGSQAFADELARCFEARGGHILMSTAARRILVEGGAARGVELETLRGPLRSRPGLPTGVTRVRCDAVVSNADLLSTWEALVGAEHLPSEYLASLHRLRPTYPCFLTHFGLAGVSTEELRAIHGYHWTDWDLDASTSAVDFKLFVPTFYEPAMAPPGGHIVIAQKVLALEDAEAVDWRACKEGVERFIRGRLEQLLPGAERRIVVQTSASAYTSWRFTLNHRGAMLGWEMAPDQLGPGRPDIRGPVAGLYTVGHWTRPGGGITPVIVSAQDVARAISQKRRDEDGGTAGLDPSRRSHAEARHA